VSYEDGYVPDRWERSVINKQPGRHHGAAPPTSGLIMNPEVMIEWLDSS
jgi:hypothetical protein